MLRTPHCLDNRLTDGCKVVSSKHRPPFTPREDFWYSFLLEAETTPWALVRLEGWGKLKSPKTLSGIEPATLRAAVSKKTNKFRRQAENYEFAVCLYLVPCLLLYPEDGGEMFLRTSDSIPTVRRYNPLSRALHSHDMAELLANNLYFH
jgi:hypothetical protein